MPEPAPCACPSPPMHAATCPALADLWPGVAPGGSSTCDASVTAFGGQLVGPCILRHQHNGPVHKAADGTTWITLADGTDALAPFRALADQYAAKAAESARNANTAPLTIRTAQQGIAAGWRSAEFLLRHTLNSADNSRTTPDNPPASDDKRRRALARNAVGPALNAHGEWLPLSVREAVAVAVLAAIDESANETPASEAAADRRYWNNRYDQEES